MSTIKTAANAALKQKQPKADRLKEWATPIIDWLAKLVAGVFFVATSYGYVSEWLRIHQSNTDLSIAGGIMVVSVALYLYLRKRGN